MIHLLVGMLVFAFFAIAGLVVDLGFARVTHRQLATAADSAALEGMRWRDTVTDDERRSSARELLRSHFDDDFYATATDTRTLGAGPLVTLTGGTTSMLANQQLTIAPSVVYEPDPQLNLVNADNGDMVGGWFDETDLAHAESATYARTDFTTTADPALREAFLVRLRRTPDKLGLDEQPGVASSGPQLPYLFGRGSMIAGEMRRDGITVRGTGVAAGRVASLVGPDFPETATDPDPANRLIGTSMLAIDAEYFASLPFDVPVQLVLGQPDQNGNAGGADPFPPGHGGLPPGQVIPPGQLVGNVNVPLFVFLDFEHHRDVTGRDSWSMGDEVFWDTAIQRDGIVAALGNPDPADPDPRLWYVPLYNNDTFLGWDGVPGLKWLNLVGFRISVFGIIQVLEVTDLPANNGNGGNGNGNGGNGNGGNGGNGNGNGGNGQGNGNNGQSNAAGFQIVIRKLHTRVAGWNASAVETPGTSGIPHEALESIRADRHMLESQGAALRAASLVR